MIVRLWGGVNEENPSLLPIGISLREERRAYVA